MARAAVKKVRGVFEHPPGSGVWWVHHYDADGKRHREKAGRRGDAIALYTKRKQQALAGVKLPEKFRSAALIFGALADMALAHSRSNKADFKHDLQRMKFILDSFAGRPAEKITPREIEQWLSDEADDNEWSPATFNRYKALFSLTFRIGVDNGKATQNPARLVKRRREDNTRVRWPLDEEEQRLREVIAEACPDHLPELDIAIHCGMRKSEQYALTWQDVDFANRVLTVRKSKNGEMRHIKLNSVALRAFLTLRDRRTGGLCVFTNASGDRRLNSKHWFDPAVAEAGIEDFTWHCLRHTFASRLVMKGAPLRSVQEFMGHRDFQMTCRYAHLAPEHQQSVVDLLVPVPIATRTATKDFDCL